MEKQCTPQKDTNHFPAEMEVLSATSGKPHAVCVPLPFQSHVNAMLKFAKILHSKGYHITFVSTEFNHRRLVLSVGLDSLNLLPADFRFETIPDGLPQSHINKPQELVALMDSITTNGLVYVRNLVTQLNQSAHSPPVSCIVSDSAMVCTHGVAEELGIPQILLWPMSATVLMSHLHSQLFVSKGFFPLKDQSDLDTPVDFVPGLRGMRLKDLPSFFWDGNGMNDIVNREIAKAYKASAIVLNTFDALEPEVLDAMKPLLPAIYTIGPLHFFEQQIADRHLGSFGFSLLAEQTDCLEWLDSRQPNSVVYVNFGSTTVMTQEQLIEFAWGLAASKHPFLWVVRPGSVSGEEVVLGADFTAETSDRGIVISGWCPQEEVLNHSSTGGFLTHSGWNSTMDAMCTGVPIICWPFFGDQQTNCWNSCVRWGIGMEINKNVRRDEVERLVRELMEGVKGNEMKHKAMEWKMRAEESAKPGGSSYANLETVLRKYSGVGM